MSSWILYTCDVCGKDIEGDVKTLTLPSGKCRDPIEGLQEKQEHIDVCSACAIEWLSILAEAFYEKGWKYTSILSSRESRCLKVYKISELIKNDVS